MRTATARLIGLVAAAALAATAGAAAQQKASDAKTHSAFVSVLDRNGLTVPSLAAADVTVREDNQAREVLEVKPAATPMTVALLIDTSAVTQPMTQELRAGATDFVTELLKARPDSQISLTTFGDRPTAVQAFTNSAPVLTKATGRLFPVVNSGAYLLDAIIDACKSFKKLQPVRPVIVAFADENGQEFSAAGRQQVRDAIHEVGASLWVVILQGGSAAMESPEARDRAFVAGDVTRQSGGASFMLLNKLSFDDKMKHVASVLATQFEVVYGRPEQIVPPSKFEVSVAAKDKTVYAPKWSK